MIVDWVLGGGWFAPGCTFAAPSRHTPSHRDITRSYHITTHHDTIYRTSDDTETHHGTVSHAAHYHGGHAASQGTQPVSYVSYVSYVSSVAILAQVVMAVMFCGRCMCCKFSPALSSQRSTHAAVSCGETSCGTDRFGYSNGARMSNCVEPM